MRLGRGRRRQLPVGVALARGERVLADGEGPGGQMVLATTQALHLSGAGERIPWHLVLQAGWDATTESLDLLEIGPTGATSRRQVPLRRAGFLPETVRERVQASIAVSRHLPLAGRAGARLVARRLPGADELLWQVVPDNGVDLSDPSLRSRVDRALAALRRETAP